MNIIAVVTEVLARAPDWIRRDLAAKDNSARVQAEESLAGMIAAAINEKQSTTVTD